MTGWVEAALVTLIVTGFGLLGTGRLRAYVWLVAAQGAALGLVTILAADGGPSLRTVLLGVAGMLFRGIVFPRLVHRAIRVAGVRREVEPYVGYTPSLLVGVAALTITLWLGGRVSFPMPSVTPLAFPTALFLLAVGLFLIVSRRTAITQVLGYLVLENGIFTFGVAYSSSEPLLIEMGILLDVFVLVFIMGITISHINREFDHIDVDQLRTLRD